MVARKPRKNRWIGDDEQHGAQRVGQQLQVGGIRVLAVASGAGVDGVVAADRHQRDADDGDHRAGDHRREEPQQLDEDTAR